MSGGQYDYAYTHLKEFSDALLDTDKNPKRAVFKQLLELVVQAMYDIEWVDSDDYGEGAEEEALDNVFNFLKGDVVKTQKAAAFDRIKKIADAFNDPNGDHPLAGLNLNAAKRRNHKCDL